ncbi:MAG: transcriptional repressor [Sulfurospirillum sp.]
MLDFRDILKYKNLKATHQRLAILETMDSLKHVDIENLYELLLSKYPTLSKATIYRNVKELIAIGLVTEIKIPDMPTNYEITKMPHIHLVCKICNKIIDKIVDTKGIIDEATKGCNFKVETSSISLLGICPECSKTLKATSTAKDTIGNL